MAKVGMFGGLVLVVALSSCSEAGKQGPAGEPGSTGEPGAPGTDGTDGALGAKGEMGAPGAQGETGVQGEPGALGDTGAQGDTGAMGVKGDTGAKGDMGAKGDAGPSVVRAPAFALLDADGKLAEALPIQNYLTPYAKPSERDCIGLLWIGQLFAAEFQVDLATGRGEPCYEHANSWSAVSADMVAFASTNCSGDPLGRGGYERLVVNGAFVEARGADLGLIGKGTPSPISYYVNGICENHTADQQSGAFKFVPVDTRFSEAFKNPPYVYKIVY